MSELDTTTVGARPATTIQIVTAVLEQAITEVGGRADTYDSPEGEESMPKIIAMFNLLYGTDLTVEQGWQFMVILKQVRSSAGEFKRDNYVDQTAYSAFACKAAEEAAGEREAVHMTTRRGVVEEDPDGQSVELAWPGFTKLLEGAKAEDLEKALLFAAKRLRGTKLG